MADVVRIPPIDSHPTHWLVSHPLVWIPPIAVFEAGREALFKLTILSDDRDDDGVPDFGFSEVTPELVVSSQ